MSIAFILAGIFLFTFLLGIFLEKIRIPWVFSALILGLVFSFYNPFSFLTNSETFKFLAWLGMYFLLFLIGFKLDFEEIKKMGRFIIKSTFFIIFFEAFFGSIIIHFVFGYSWIVSILAAFSFATVGEGILVPILDEFNLIKRKIGQAILGVGILDDIIEVFIIVAAIFLIPFLLNENESWTLQFNKILTILFSFFILFLLYFVIFKLKKTVSQVKIKRFEPIFLLIFGIFFLFIALGDFSNSAALGALLAGIAIKNLFSFEKISAIEPEIRAITYGFFAPLFFFWVGLDVNIKYLISSPFLIVLVIGVCYGVKILATYIVGRKELGARPSVFMGIALGVRFSTSIVIIKFLFEKGLIEQGLYSVLLASSIVSVIIPFFISFLIKKWEADLYSFSK